MCYNGNIREYKKGGDTVATLENLKPLSWRPEEEFKALSAKGGRASGVAKRKAKSMREAARLLLEAPLLDDEQVRQALETLGLDPDQQSAILLKAIEQARRGDMESARYVRDTSGQAPAQQVALGGVDGAPITTVDLTGMSADELQQLIADAEKPG